MKVEIVSCSCVGYWYSDKIGHIFEVEDNPYFSQTYAVIDSINSIRKEDCREVFEVIHKTKGKIEVIESTELCYQIAGKAELVWKGYCKPIEQEKEMKQEFTKSDLKNFMRVKYRNGDVRIYMDGRLYDGASCRGYIDYYDENLICHHRPDTNIAAVFEEPVGHDLNVHMQGGLIWERKEKSQQEIELEKLQEQIKALEKQAQKLKETLK